MRGAGSTRKRSSKFSQDDESEYSIESMTGGGAAGRKSASYALSTGLDSDTGGYSCGFEKLLRFDVQIAGAIVEFQCGRKKCEELMVKF